MSIDKVVIGRAVLADVDGILQLAEANHASRDGSLTGTLRREAVAETIEAMPCVVARSGGNVLGFLLAWKKEPSNPPWIKAMLNAYSRADNAYIYGPICVDAPSRGRGIAGAMFAELRRLLPGREGILFIRGDNEASLRAHAKLGMSRKAEYVYEGSTFVVLAYDG
jgi:GNAT superfamily N-acetyltransferase